MPTASTAGLQRIRRGLSPHPVSHPFGEGREVRGLDRTCLSRADPLGQEHTGDLQAFYRRDVTQPAVPLAEPSSST